MAAEPQSEGGPVRPVVALAFATAGFVALAIFGLGMTSLVTGQDVIAEPGLGQIPGIAGTVLATAGFAAALWASIRRPHPSFGGAAWTTIASILGYLGGVWIGAVVSGSGPATASAVVGALAVSWFALVIAASGFVAGWSGIALVRTRARRPRWPWEDEFDE